MFAKVTRVSACGESDADRFTTLGVSPEQLTITGNLKFDLVLPTEAAQAGAALRELLGANKFIWIAASTHEGEEDIILKAHQQLLAVDPHALLMLVPRHPDRFDSIANLAAASFKMQRRSKHEVIAEDTTVYVGDTMGEMLVMYAAADVALVAGSLIPRGGHNILEPAVLSKPILTGEHVFNFAEICQLFLRENAMVKITDADSLAQQLIYLMQHVEERDALGQRARSVMDANRGALAKQLQVIRQLMATQLVTLQNNAT
jgi:3-deoxy-D-manno-octulosonic-acid transferase